MTDLKDKLMLTLGGGGLFALDTPVTEGGTGGYLNVGVVQPNWDVFESASFSLGGSFLKTNGSLYQDSFGEGTGTENRWLHLGFEVGTSDRGMFQNDSSGKPWFAGRKLTSYGISLAWLKQSSPDRSAGGWDFDGESESSKVLAFTKKQGIGGELWIGNEWHIMPTAGIYTQALHHFGSYEEWPYSPMGLGVYLGVEGAWGVPSNNLVKGRGLSPLRISRILYQEAFDVAYNSILYHNFSGTQANGMDLIDEIYGDGGGVGSSGSLGFTDDLSALSAYLDTGAKLRLVGAYLDARRDGSKLWRGIFIGVELAKAIGYTAAAGGGENAEDAIFRGHGIAAADGVAAMLFSEFTPEGYLYAVGLGFGALEIVLPGIGGGTSATAQAFRNAGTVVAAGWAKDPGVDVAKSGSTTYSPVGYKFLGETSGFIGGISGQKNLKGLPLFLNCDFFTPAAMVKNLGTMGYNTAQNPEDESSFTDLAAPSFIASGLGAKWNPGDTVQLDLGASLNAVSQYRGGGSKGGLGLKAHAALNLVLPKNDKISDIFDIDKIAIRLGLSAMGYSTLGDDNDAGITLAPELGLQTWF